MQKPTTDELVKRTVAEIMERANVPPELTLLIETTAEAGIWRGLNLAAEIRAGQCSVSGAGALFLDN